MPSSAPNSAVQLELDRGAELSGRMTYEGYGSGGFGFAVLVLRTGAGSIGQRQAILRSGEDAFSFKGLEPGNYQMLLFIENHRSEPLEVSIPEGGLSEYVAHFKAE